MMIKKKNQNSAVLMLYGAAISRITVMTVLLFICQKEDIHILRLISLNLLIIFCLFTPGVT